MSGTPKRSWVLPALMLLVTAVVASTAIRIEWYNHAVGGFLPRPQPPSVEGNDVKWRTTSADTAELAFRRALAYEREQHMSDNALAEMDLSAQDRDEIQRVRRQAVLHARFRGLVASMGLLQYALVPVGIGLCIVCLRQRIQSMKALSVAGLLIHGIAAFLLVYREYYFALGW